MTIDELQTVDSLMSIENDWRRLWQVSPLSTPFQNPSWLLPMWRNLGEGRLWTITFREGHQLIGLIPLYIQQETLQSEKRLFLLGTGTSDVLEGVYAPGREAEIVGKLWKYLDKHRSRFDFAEFVSLRSNSPLLRPQGSQISDCCPTLALPKSADRLEETIPGRTVHNLQYYLKRAEKEGELLLSPATNDSLDEAFDVLLAMHFKVAEEAESEDPLANPLIQSAHRQALRGLHEQGLLRLYLLRLKGAAIAVYYGFMDRAKPNRQAYHYLSAISSNHTHLSPGTILVGLAIKEAIKEGAAEFNFLRGAEAYKYVWGAKDVPSYKCTFTPANILQSS